MDILDNLMYASYVSPTRADMPFGFPPQLPQGAAADRIISDYLPAFPALPPPTNIGSPLDPVFSYGVADKMDFCAYEDPIVTEKAILRHWYDVDVQANYDSVGVTAAGTAQGANDRYASFGLSSSYHLIYAYLLENTRMFQIFERLIDKYLNDEELGIIGNNQVLNWVLNTERLFFKGDTPRSTNLRSLIRPDANASRRNAYWRMFGMDLAFGDINSPGNTSIPYTKARVSNQQFVVLFERYLSEIWQSYTNANNTSGVNSSDVNIVVDLALQVQELLRARRGDPSNTYANLNLSREEFSSVLMASWFTFIITVDSPVVLFLNCQSSTIGERLLKIGNKVGIPAHGKSQAIFEMAGSASNVLRIIEEGGRLEDPTNVGNILRSLIPPLIGNPTPDRNLMSDLLTVINNWERATGHKIKHTEGNITGMVRVQQNVVKPQPTMN
jgi:hypothetical protein